MQKTDMTAKDQAAFKQLVELHRNADGITRLGCKTIAQAIAENYYSAGVHGWLRFVDIDWAARIAELASNNS